MKVIMDSKNTGNDEAIEAFFSETGVDPITWEVIWRAHSKGYDLPDFIHTCKELLEQKMDPVYFKTMLYAINNGYDIPHFFDSWSPSQRASKEWLVLELQKIFKDLPVRIQIFGGWFGYPLSDKLMESLNVEFIENIDMDSKAIKLFRYFSENKGLDERTTPRMIGTNADVREPNKREWSTDIVINTSSEHMPNLPDIIQGRDYRTSEESLKRFPKDMNHGCLFALQSNNMFHIDDHINCVMDEDELVKKSGLSDIRYKGSLKMPNGYRRFMVIGYV
jgi:hypothetical protein